MPSLYLGEMESANLELAQSSTRLLAMPAAHRYGRAVICLFFYYVVCRAFMLFFFVAAFAWQVSANFARRAAKPYPAR